MTTWEERLSEFYKEELIVCSKCGHSKESHYWNGGGRPENSGYDACHSCDCSCMGDEVVKEYIQDHKYMTDFISQELQKQKEEIVEIIRGMKKEAPPKDSILMTYEFGGTLKQLSENIAYNQALDDIIKKLEEGK